MSEELDNIKEKLDAYLDKKGLSTKDRYFVTKSLSDDYLSDVLDDEDVSPDDFDVDEVSDDDAELYEPTPEELDEVEDDAHKPVNHKNGIGGLIKKSAPKIKK